MTRGPSLAVLAVLAMLGCIDTHPALPEPIELCNAVDDDASPGTSDGADEPSLGEPCDGPDDDLCATGAIRCESGALLCVADDDTADDGERCNELDDDCDGMVDEGVDLLADAENCGFCGNVCENAHGSTACNAGTCRPVCLAGAADCNANPDDGCEVFRNANPMCNASSTMGDVAGDLGPHVAELGGTDESYFQVAVLEVSTAKTPVTATITLENPPGVNFDLFVRCTSCASAPFASSTLGAGLTDTVQFRTEDDDFVTDSVTLFVEVRYVNATSCGAPWHLTVTGGTAVTATTATCP